MVRHSGSTATSYVGIPKNLWTDGRVDHPSFLEGRDFTQVEDSFLYSSAPCGFPLPPTEINSPFVTYDLDREFRKPTMEACAPIITRPEQVPPRHRNSKSAPLTPYPTRFYPQLP